jgi:hypothetical protein
MEKFLLDENIPPAIGDFLREKGFDVDKHFADIISYPPGHHHGIIRIRIHPPLIAHILRRGS